MSDNYHQTQNVLANAVELAVAVVTEIAGNETSSSLNGEHMDQTSIADLVTAKLQAKLANHLA